MENEITLSERLLRKSSDDGVRGIALAGLAKLKNTGKATLLVGLLQESAGKPYFTCIAFTAVRLNCPITPSTLPTLKPARTNSCCSSFSSLSGSCATGADGCRIGGAPAMRDAR